MKKQNRVNHSRAVHEAARAVLARILDTAHALAYEGQDGVWIPPTIPVWIEGRLAPARVLTAPLLRAPGAVPAPTCNRWRKQETAPLPPAQGD